MRTRRALRVLIAVVIGCVIACGGHSPTTPTEPLKPIVTFTIAGNGNLTAIGETRQFTATVTHADGVTEDVTKGTAWQVADRSVGDFGLPGLLTSKAVGETMVTGRYQQKSDSMRVSVLPVGTHILTGKVTEPGFVIFGATVEILDGPSTGLSKTTDTGGAYKFYGVGGDVTVRVRKDGYVEQTQRVSMTQDRAIDFTLMPTQLPGRISAGAYRATFTASPSCSQLPDDLKSRTYGASLGQEGARLDVTLSGSGLTGAPPAEMKFSGRIVDTTVTFYMSSSYDSFYGYGFISGPGILLEQVTSTRYFSLFGIGTGTIAGSSISGKLAGSFQSIDAPNGLNKSGTRITTCAKSDHQFAFTTTGVVSSRRTR